MAGAILLGPDGQPIRRAELRREVATATIGGVRPLYDDYPSQGLTPARLGRILRNAVEDDLRDYVALAEEMEEKDLHYLAVLGTRKRQVAQLEITVKPADDSQPAVDQAAFVEAWLRRECLEEEMFDLLDAVGKGFSCLEIVWDTSEGQWWPQELLWRDPRWFAFDRDDGRTLRLRTEADSILGEALPPHKFITHSHKAKSGLAIRSGLARAAAWVWLFKNFDLKSWIAFAEAYGQPLRIGRYGAEADDDDRAILLRAVSRLGRDSAAIIPESMAVEIVQANITGSVDLFMRLADWLDQQISKAVLGQTTTTDAISGGHAVSREHNEVREDIERADARQVAATLNAQLIRPMIAFNFGPQPAYPRLTIGRPEDMDTATMIDALARLPGLRASRRHVLQILRIPPAEDDADILAVPSRMDTPEAARQEWRTTAAARSASQATRPEADDLGPLIDRLGREADPELQQIVSRVRQILAESADLVDASQRLLALYPELGLDRLGELIGDALTVGDLIGADDVADDPISDIADA